MGVAPPTLLEMNSDRQLSMAGPGGEAAHCEHRLVQDSSLERGFQAGKWAEEIDRGWRVSQGHWQKERRGITTVVTHPLSSRPPTVRPEQPVEKTPHVSNTERPCV